jgi:serine/threonine-protein kinase RsbW
MNAKQNIGRAREIFRAAPFVELDQTIPSRASAISPLLNRFMRFIEFFMGKVIGAREDGDGIEIALGEAVANAVIHGNHEDPEKRVFVNCRCSMDGEVLVTVRDQGQGFDSQSVADPTGPERLFLTHGRGLHLMRALMDEVAFEEKGTVVRMRKRMKAGVR